MQDTFLYIVVRADDSLGTKISWMHFRRFPFNQNLRNFGNSGNWYSISPKSSQTSGNFSEMRTIQPEVLEIREQSWMRKENFQEIIFENLCIHLENAVPFATRSCQKFKPEVLIEWNGAHAKVTKFVTNCAPFARARESSTKKVSQVKFSFGITGCSMKSWFNLTDCWKQKLCFDLFIILISI